MTSFMRNGIPRKENGKIDFTPKKHHGFTGVIMIAGFLLPPLAVLIRFGFGKDFAINVLCTICGYIPGHGHNWFIQNVRNNDNRNRTPKWAKRYGLVDDSAITRKQKKRGWVGRYHDQNPDRVQYDDTGKQFIYQNGHKYEDGDNMKRPRRREDGTLIERDQFYNGDGERRPGTSSSRSESIREDPYAIRRSRSSLSDAGGMEKPRSKSKSKFFGGGKKGKKDRFERSEEVEGMGGVGAGHAYDDEFDRELQGNGQQGSSNGTSAGRMTGRAPPVPRSTSHYNQQEWNRTKSNTSGNQRYQNYREDSTPPPPLPKPQKDIMDMNHEF